MKYFVVKRRFSGLLKFTFVHMGFCPAPWFRHPQKSLQINPYNKLPHFFLNLNLAEHLLYLFSGKRNSIMIRHI